MKKASKKTLKKEKASNVRIRKIANRIIAKYSATFRKLAHE